MVMHMRFLAMIRLRINADDSCNSWVSIVFGTRCKSIRTLNFVLTIESSSFSVTMYTIVSDGDDGILRFILTYF